MTGVLFGLTFALAAPFWALKIPTLGGLRDALSTANGAAAAWAHMVAFDLFVGRWCFLDARERGVRHLILAPILVLTILFGPLGLAAYLAVPKRLG
ncbi:abscisic acid-deficient protein Aba4 family protein [Paractinoplanes globisporus]|uniref:Abscisic acid-deficient protein Aba4 family protein n=1 Tax=Paractinoplanes globisporus TaxID=113565 RepID=A0ABW6WLV8_9ACTN|nr:abscisic acid-deficient protein Aba4 family protein [Actinoplanes globisporus]